MTEEAADIQLMIEAKKVEPKIEAIENLISLYRNGDKATAVNLLMPVIQHCAVIDHNGLKRLLLEYYAAIGISDSEGKLRDPFILVCNAFTQDLQSHNEYLVGITLRFLSKITEKEILQQVITPVTNCLTNTHAYARRQAIVCVYSIYKEYPDLIPDAPDIIFNMLADEHDGLCQRNSLLMLFHCAQDKALQFLTANAEIVQSFSHPVQLLIVELVRTQCRARPSEKSQWLKCILKLVSSSSNSVKYSCAKALLSLSSNPSAVKAAAQCYSDVLLSVESDNNIKLVVLDRLSDMRPQHNRLLERSINLLPIFIASTSSELRKRTLTLALDLLTPATLPELLQTLRKEALRLLEKARAMPGPAPAAPPPSGSNPTPEESERKHAVDDRMMIVGALQTCALSFAETVPDVAALLLEFVHDPDAQCAATAMNIIKELTEVHPQSRALVMPRLMESLKDMRSARALHVALWLLGEYPESADQCARAMAVLREAIGPVPFVRDAPVVAASPAPGAADNKPRIMADGSYAPQTSTALPSAPAKDIEPPSDLRGLLLNGDFFLATTLAAAMAKLVLRAALSDAALAAALKQQAFEALIALIAYGQRPFLAVIPSIPVSSASLSARPHKCLTEVVMGPDDLERICICLDAMENPSDLSREMFLQLGRAAFTGSVQASMQQRAEDKEKSRAAGGPSAPASRGLAEPARTAAADQLIAFRHFAPKADDSATRDEAEELLMAAAEPADPSKTQIVQLTGYSDPIYCEAAVNVSHYNILLDITVVNRTSDTFKDMAIELSTVGDLSASDTTIPVALPPNQSTHVRTAVKIVSTETGAIHSCLVYRQGRDTLEKFVLLRDIHLDVVHCIGPAPAPSPLEYRTMWSQFEWENKIPVKCSKTMTIPDFLQQLALSANMSLLAYGNPLRGTCNYASANLYARSIFGEDVLLHVSVEQDAATGRLVGFCRIRSKQQGIALALGDKIALSMA